RTNWVDRVLLSDDGALDAGDLELARVNHNGVLGVGANYAAVTTASLPNGIEGPYHVFVVTDLHNNVFEFNFEGNNTGRTVAPIDVTRRPDPDLVVTALTIPTDGQPGQAIDIDYTVQNTGPGEARGPWVDRVYLSADGSLTGATLLATVTRDENIAGLVGNYDESVPITLPVVADGSYRVVVVTDQADAVFEGLPGSPAETNNARVSDGALTIGHPDLQAQITSAPASVVSGQPISIGWNTLNAGSAATLGAWVDRVYLSLDSDFDPGVDRLIGEVSQPGPLAPATSTSVNLEALVPIDVSGPRFLLVVTDAADDINEVGEEDNNVNGAPIDVTLAPFADLEVSNIRGPPLSVGDPVEVTLDWTLTNLGTGTGTVEAWTERVFASTDDVFGDGDDRLLAEVTHTGFIAPGTSVERSHTFLLPPAFEGRFVLYVQTDADNEVFENGFESNNVARLDGDFDVVKIPYADLVVESVVADPAGASGQPLSVSWRVRNNPANAIGSTNSSAWNDRVRLATNPDGSGVIANFGFFTHVGALGVDGFYDRAVEVTLPHGLTGTYYLVVETGGPFEFVFTGNNTNVSNAFEVTLTPPPDLTVSDIVVPDNAVTSGSAIDVFWTVRNEGPGVATGSWTDRLRLVEVGGGGKVISLGAFTYISEPTGLQAGTTYTRQERFTLPVNTSGVFRAEVTTNANNALFELGVTANNTVLDDATLEIQLLPRPDLQVQQIIAPAEASAGGTVQLDFIVINQGTVETTTPRWKDNVYLSLDNLITGDDVLIGSLDNGSALQPGEQYRSRTDSLLIPRRFRGPVFLIVRTDNNNRVDEFPNDNNNTLAVEIDILPLPPSDLVLSDVVAPDQVFDGSTIQVSYKVTNLGAGETDRDAWTETLWLTRDKNRPSPLPPVDNQPQDFLLSTFTHTGSLMVGESYTVTRSVRLPSNITGQFFITPWTDSTDIVLEDTFDVNINPDDPNELDNNNYKARPITILLTPPPDLIVEQVDPQAVGFGGEAFTTTWTVRNIGQGPTQQSQWADKVYLSKTPDLTGPNLHLGNVTHTGVLEVDQAYTASATFNLTPAAAGQYVIVVTGAGVFEGPLDDNNDNLGPTDVTNRPADFIVTDVDTPSVSFSGEPATIGYTVRNIGPRVWDGTRYWKDEVWISPDPTFIRGRATLLGTVTHSNSGGFDTGESYTTSSTFTLPRGIGGQYYIYVFTNIDGSDRDATGSNDFSRDSFVRRAFETRGNNEGSAPIPVTYREPDLVVTNLTTPAGPPTAGESITVDWTVTNLGTRRTREGAWYDRVYLSNDPSLDFSDQFLGGALHLGHLDIGAAYTRSATVSLPDDVEGDFYLLVFTDSSITGPPPPGGPWVGFEYGINTTFARVPEYQDEGNNITAEPMTVRHQRRRRPHLQQDATLGRPDLPIARPFPRPRRRPIPCHQRPHRRPPARRELYRHAHPPRPHQPHRPLLRHGHHRPRPQKPTGRQGV
ncbi:MAG: CARDB domain-containing protein, partial [Planctomycetota bacterium]